MTTRYRRRRRLLPRVLLVQRLNEAAGQIEHNRIECSRLSQHWEGEPLIDLEQQSKHVHDYLTEVRELLARQLCVRDERSIIEFELEDVNMAVEGFGTGRSTARNLLRVKFTSDDDEMLYLLKYKNRATYT